MKFIERVGDYVMYLFNGQYVVWYEDEKGNHSLGHYFDDYISAIIDLEKRGGEVKWEKVGISPHLFLQ